VTSIVNYVRKLPVLLWNATKQGLIFIAKNLWAVSVTLFGTIIVIANLVLLGGKESKAPYPVVQVCSRVDSRFCETFLDRLQVVSCKYLVFDFVLQLEVSK